MAIGTQGHDGGVLMGFYSSQGPNKGLQVCHVCELIMPSQRQALKGCLSL